MAGRYLRALTAESWLFVTPEFAGLETPARKVVFDFEAAGIKGSRKNLGLLMAAAALAAESVPGSGVRRGDPPRMRSPIREESLETLRTSALTADLLADTRS